MIQLTKGSSTIGSTEFSLVSGSTSLAAAITPGRLDGWIDFSAMAAGDQYQVLIKDKVNGGSQLPLTPFILTGAQSGPFVIPNYLVAEGWDVTVKKLTGTDRTIPYSLRQRIEVTAVVGKAVTGTLGSSSFTTNLTQPTNAFVDAWITFIGGSLAGQAHQIGAFTNSGGQITLVAGKAFSAAPANNDQFLIINQ